MEAMIFVRVLFLEKLKAKIEKVIGGSIDINKNAKT